MVAEFTRAFAVEINNVHRDGKRATSRYERELSDVNRSLNDFIDALTRGFKGDTLQARRTALTALISSAPPPAPRLYPNIAEMYRRKVTELAAALRDPDQGAKALEVVRGLVEGVLLCPLDGGWKIELIGAVAHMNKMGTGDDAFAREPYASSVKVVAGARLNRNRHSINVYI